MIPPVARTACGRRIATCPCRKALDLLDETRARARIPTISKPADKMVGLVVTARTVAEVLGEWKGISAETLLDTD